MCLSEVFFYFSDLTRYHTIIVNTCGICDTFVELSSRWLENCCRYLLHAWHWQLRRLEKISEAFARQGRRPRSRSFFRDSSGIRLPIMSRGWWNSMSDSFIFSDSNSYLCATNCAHRVCRVRPSGVRCRRFIHILLVQTKRVETCAHLAKCGYNVDWMRQEQGERLQISN